MKISKPSNLNIWKIASKQQLDNQGKRLGRTSAKSEVAWQTTWSKAFLKTVSFIIFYER